MIMLKAIIQASTFNNSLSKCKIIYIKIFDYIRKTNRKISDFHLYSKNFQKYTMIKTYQYSSERIMRDRDNIFQSAKNNKKWRIMRKIL